MNEKVSLSLPITVAVNSLIDQMKNIKMRLAENTEFISRETDFLLCPVCQEGHLRLVEQGKRLFFFNKKWLICNKCSAEFEMKFDKAKLVKSINDPYGIYQQYSFQTLKLYTWKGIAFKRIHAENNDLEKELSVLNENLGQSVLQQCIESNIKLLCVKLDSFILKNNEIPLFSTKASILEERKRKFTERTTTGGGSRNYSGVSFRVAKGIYYHAGSSRAASPRQTIVNTTEYTELVAADIGDFLVTNQRILFKGNKGRGIVLPINKLVSIDIDKGENVLVIMQENKKPYILKPVIDIFIEFFDIKIDLPVNLEYIATIIKSASQIK